MNTPIRKPTVAEFVARKMSQSGVTYEQVATALGYDNPNIVRMITAGTMKLPIARLVPLANIINADPAQLLRLVLDDYLPGVFDVIEECLDTMLLSQNESDLIEVYRRRN